MEHWHLYMDEGGIFEGTIYDIITRRLSMLFLLVLDTEKYKLEEELRNIYSQYYPSDVYPHAMKHAKTNEFYLCMKNIINVLQNYHLKFFYFKHKDDVYYNDIIFRAYNGTTGDDSYIKHHIWGHSVEPAESENYIETGGVHHTVTQVNIPGFAGNFSIKRAGTDIELYAMGSLMATFADESYNKISITHIGYFTPNSLYVNDFIFKIINIVI